MVWLGGCAGSLSSGQPFGATQQLAGDSTATKRPAGANGVVAMQAAASSTGSGGSYKIGPMDILDISVFRVPELTKSVQVSASGAVNLPLVGEMQAAGKTSEQLERELTKKLGAQYLQHPQVTVFVKKYNSQRATISGAVNKPGVYPIAGDTTLMQIVATAGGLVQTSDSTVLVVRNSGGKRSAAKFDVGAIQKGAAPDPAIQAGDLIVAGNSAIRSGFNTILKALPLAGLFTVL